MHSKYPLTNGRSAFLAVPDDGNASEPPRDPQAEAEHLAWLVNLKSGLPPYLSSLEDPPPGEKPDYSYLKMVALAIYGSESQMLTLQGIYDALQARFSWFSTCDSPAVWKNSVRHLLSLNAVFQKKINPQSGEGTGIRGSYWFLDLNNWGSLKRKRKRGPVPRKSRSKQQSSAVAPTAGQMASDGEEEIDELESDTDDANSLPGCSRRLREGHAHEWITAPSYGGNQHVQKSPAVKTAAIDTSAYWQDQNRPELPPSDTDETDSDHDAACMHIDDPVAATSIRRGGDVHQWKSQSPTYPVVQDMNRVRAEARSPQAKISPSPRNVRITADPRRPARPASPSPIFRSKCSRQFEACGPHLFNPPISAAALSSTRPPIPFFHQRPEYRYEASTPRLVPATFPSTSPR